MDRIEKSLKTCILRIHYNDIIKINVIGKDKTDLLKPLIVF